MEATLATAAEAYGLGERTLRNYRHQGVDVSSPSKVLDHLLANGSARSASCVTLEALAAAERRLLLAAAAGAIDALNAGNGELRCPHCQALLAQAVDHD